MQAREATRGAGEQSPAASTLSANDRQAYDAALTQGMTPEQALRYARGEIVTYALDDPNAPKPQQLQVETTFADGSEGHWIPERDYAGYYDHQAPATEPLFDRHPLETRLNLTMAQTKGSILGGLGLFGGQMNALRDQGGLAGLVGDAGFALGAGLSIATEIGFPESMGELLLSAGGGALGMLGKAGRAAGSIDDIISIGGRSLDDIRALPPGARPDPASYLSADYISEHLARFDDGASYLVPKAALDRWGRDTLGRADGQFVMPSQELDEVLRKTGGDLSLVEKELGINPGDWQGREFVRVDVFEPRSLDLRMPSGNESGANPLWVPGGRLPTGYSEATINQIPRGSYQEWSYLDALKRLGL